MFFRSNHNRKKQYEVCWEARLDVRFPDFHGQMPVKVTNFSSIGAMLEAEQIFLNKRHLIDAHYRPRLTLKIFLPDGLFESEVNIIWYRWSVEKIAFEIRINFMDILKDKALFADQLITGLHY